VRSVETSDSGSAWFRAALIKDDDIALTDRGRYVAIMTRTALVTEVLIALSRSASASEINRCPFHIEVARVLTEGVTPSRGCPRARGS
jgi:hypothetical protein